MESDGELLRRYVEEKSEAAFTELVGRHIGVVYHAARRRLGGDAHAADDVAQRVFAQLARKAPGLTSHPSLTGWLYTATRFAAAQAVRTAQRRRAYEEKAQAMRELEETTAAEAAARFEPLLDEVMDLLPAADRHALLLHFFEGRSFVEVGTAMSVKPDAARMRVNRALERLRAGFARRGIASTAALLGSVLSAQAAATAPAALTRLVAHHALGEAAAAGNAGVLLRLWREMRPGYLIGAGSMIVGLAGLGLFHLALRPQTTALAAGPAETRSQPAPSEPGVVVEGKRAEPEKNAASSAAPVGRRGLQFADLTEEERNILALLWRSREQKPPGMRTILRVGAGAPNAPGVEPLLLRGFLKTEGDGMLLFTRAGVAFCARHEEEIDRYEITSPAPRRK